MCLIVSKQKVVKAQKADEDIICYKIAEVYNSRLISPYFGVTIKTDITMNSPRFNYSCNWQVYFGFHSFVDIEHATRELRYWYSNSGKLEKHQLWECKIPKGTMYYLGDFNDILDSYASESIKFIKQLNFIL